MTRFGNTKFALATIALIGFGATNTASAGPFDPAYRGDPNSVHAIFDWVGPGVGLWDNPVFTTGPSAFPLDPTVPMASDNGLDMRIELPNFIDQLPVKFMRIQFLFATAVPGSSIVPFVLAFDPFPTTVTLTGSSGPGLGAAHYIDYEIQPNPDWEQIVLPGDIVTNMIPGNLLRIEIDTVSTVPTPGPLALLAVGASTLLRRRR